VHCKSKCSKLKNKDEGNKICSFFVAGVVEENYEGSKLVIAITVSDGRFNDM
jgi:hypothetical protein